MEKKKMGSGFNEKMTATDDVKPSCQNELLQYFICKFTINMKMMGRLQTFLIT